MNQKNPLAGAIVIAAAVIGFSYAAATIGPNPVNIGYLAFDFALSVWVIYIGWKQLSD